MQVCIFIASLLKNKVTRLQVIYLMPVKLDMLMSLSLLNRNRKLFSADIFSESSYLSHFLLIKNNHLIGQLGLIDVVTFFCLQNHMDSFRMSLLYSGSQALETHLPLNYQGTKCLRKEEVVASRKQNLCYCSSAPFF